VRKAQRRKRNHHMVSVNDLELGDMPIGADDIFRTLTAEKRRQLGELAANRNALTPGDRLVFYMAGRNRYCFVASGTVASRRWAIPDDARALFSGDNLPFMDLEFEIADVQIWPKPVRVKPCFTG